MSYEKCAYVMKMCRKCGEVKHISKFSKQKQGKYGVQSKCKSCKKEYNRNYYENNKETILEHQKQYYENNKETILEQRKQYYENNKETIAEQRKQYRESPQGQVVKFNASNRRRSKLANQSNDINKDQWLEMMKFFGFRCAYSGISLSKNIRSIDHIVALDNGGLNEIWNCVPMLKNYNSSKRTQDMEEWYKKQDFYSEERLQKIYEWQEYAWNKWGNKKEE